MHTTCIRIAVRSIYHYCLVVFTVAALLPTASEGQIRTWALTTSGAWDVDSNWTGNDFPNSPAESAVLGGTTSYSVGFDLASVAINELSINNANAHLVIAPDLSNAFLTVNNGFTNFGSISINSNSGLDSGLGVASGTLINGGTINFAGSSTLGSTNRRLGANLINNGTVNVNQDGHLAKTSGTYTNNNIFNINAVLDFEATFGTFNQDGGTVNNSGSFVFSSDTLNFNGGNFTGNAVTLDNSTLNIGVGSTGTGTFNMTRVGNYSGDLAANQVINILDGIANTSVNATADFTNNGIINLNSNSLLDVQLFRSGTITNANIINFGGTSTSTATKRRINADLVNNGTINVNQDAHLTRANGSYTNNNTVNIAASKVLDFESSFGTFNQNGGTVNNLGSFNFSSDTLNFNGGNFTGNAITLDNSTLNIGVGSVGTGTFNMFRSSNYSGDLAANQVLNILDGISNTSVTATADFTNNGVINLNSDTLLDVQLFRAGTITNANIINFGGSSTSTATNRRINANLVNNGTVNVNQDAHLTKASGIYTNNNTINIAASKILDFESTSGTFNQDAGTVNNLGSFNFLSDTLNFNGGNFTGNAITLDNSTLNIGAGSTGTGTFNMLRAGNYSGDLANLQVLNILENGGSNTSVVATSGFVNNGQINIDSDSAFDVQLFSNGTITNESLINFGGTSISSATFRRLSAALVNNGKIDIVAEGLNTEIGQAGNNHSNNGLIVSRQSGSIVEFLGSSFTNETGGELSGLGEYDFTQTSLINNGKISAGFGAGQLNLDGSIQFGTTAQLEIELGGTLQGTEYDFVNAFDDLSLDGDLNITLIDGFENSILNSDSFTILSAGTLTGTFDGVADGDTIATTDGFGTFTVNYVGNDVVLSNFQVTGIPEPASAGIVLVILATSFLQRRRRN